MGRRGANGRVELFLPLAPAGSCPYSGEDLAAKQASDTLTARLNSVLSSGWLYLLGLNNSPRAQNGLERLVNALQGYGCFKSTAGYLFQKRSHH